MKTLKRIFFLVAAGAGLLLAQFRLQSEPHTRFRRYDVRSGLSNSTVKDVLQDRNGYMWFATRDGLNRFNGEEFISFCSSAQGTGLNIDAICLHRYRDKIWIGSTEGLYLFNPAGGDFQRVDLDGRVTESVNCLVYDNAGNLWIGCLSGVYKYNDEDSSLDFYALPMSNAIASDEYGNILVGHSDGLSKYLPETSSFGKTLIPSGNHGRGREEYRNITAIKRIEADKFLIGTRDGAVAEFNESTNAFRDLSPIKFPESFPTPARIHDFQPAGDGEFYVGADNGMFILDTISGRWELCDNEISRESIYRFFVDREEGLWIGTYFCGVNYRPQLLERIDCFLDEGKPGSLHGTAVSEFCPDGKGNIWIGTENGGLNCFNAASGIFTDFSSLSHNNIHALCLDGDRLWIGTFSKGLDCLDLGSMKVRKFSSNPTDTTSLCSDFVYSLLLASDGGLYVGTLGGLCILDPQSGRFTKVSEMGSGFICDLYEDSAGDIWAADRNCGIFRKEKECGKWVHYCFDENDQSSLPDDHITRISTDALDRLWFCTEKGGICRYAPDTDSFIRVGERQGLPTSVYYGLLDDGTGNLWLSSNRGIIRYNLQTRSYRQYTAEDGLQSNQFNYRSSFKAEDGKMYFGGVGGFNSFYPIRIVPGVVKPQVNISSVTARYSGEGQSISGEILDISSGAVRLPHSIVCVDISVDCLSYAAPSRNLISWKMGGVNGDWVITDVKTISFSNLKAGKHTFAVRACNGDGLWSEGCASLDVIVTPHPMRSWWAILIYILVGIALVFAVAVFYRRRKAEKEQQRLVEAKIEFFNQIFHNVNLHSEEVVRSAGVNQENDEKWMNRLNGIIRDNLSNGDFSVDMLAAQMAVSRSLLQRRMKSLLGITPNDYIRLVRLNAAKELLSTGQYRVNEVCWMVGFNNLSYFTKCFSKQFGVLPKNCNQK